MGNKAPKGGSESSSSSSEDLEKLAQETTMTKEQLKELLSSFKKLADKDGLVHKDAFREVIKKHYGAENQSTLVYLLFNLFDRDSSKSIDFREFVLALQVFSKPTLDDAVDLTFRCIDLNNDGSITKAELKEVMTMNAKLKRYIEIQKRNGSLDNVQLTPVEISDISAEADGIFEQMDKDKNKFVSKEEFMQALSLDEELKQRVTSLLMISETKHLFTKN